MDEDGHGVETGWPGHCELIKSTHSERRRVLSYDVDFLPPQGVFISVDYVNK